mmetsp:Transcript_18135/g.68548  ORF Transcript_18135/g.68548 Transcript_18135/m.68548 type:complete len:321 (+) Transcript_18135:194-1156(+)
MEPSSSSSPSSPPPSPPPPPPHLPLRPVLDGLLLRLMCRWQVHELQLSLHDGVLVLPRGPVQPLHRKQSLLLVPGRILLPHRKHDLLRLRRWQVRIWRCFQLHGRGRRLLLLRTRQQPLCLPDRPLRHVRLRNLVELLWLLLSRLLLPCRVVLEHPVVLRLLDCVLPVVHDVQAGDLLRRVRHRRWEHHPHWQGQLSRRLLLRQRVLLHLPRWTVRIQHPAHQQQLQRKLCRWLRLPRGLQVQHRQEVRRGRFKLRPVAGPLLLPGRLRLRVQGRGWVLQHPRDCGLEAAHGRRQVHRQRRLPQRCQGSAYQVVVWWVHV